MRFSLRQLGLPHTVERVDTREDFLRELGAGAPDLILSDYHLPSFDGLAALELSQELGRVNKAKVDVGTSPPLDLVSAQAEVTSRTVAEPRSSS